MLLEDVEARKIKDYRGEDTIEVSVNGCRASAPSGKSKGKFETPSYKTSLDWCIDFLNSWNEPPIPINDFDDLEGIEDEIRMKLGVRNVKKFGADALFAFESAILKALAKEQEKELWEVIDSGAKKFPYPIGNVVVGGLHSIEFKDRPDIQEFLVIPKAKSFSENVNIMNEFHRDVGKEMRAKQKNDEGAWQTTLSDQEIIDVMNFVRSKLRKKYKNKIEIGLDIAASSMHRDDDYYYYKHKGKMNRNRQINYMGWLIEKNDLFYVEDPMHEQDFSGFYKVSKNVKNRCMIVGDDLTATQIGRVEKAKRMNSINAMIIKPNQNGSLLELKKIFAMCKRMKIRTIMAHRSGETTDDSLSDYAFGFGADYLKAGISTKRRGAKLNRMIEIEKSLKK